MAKSWAEVAANPAYQALTPDQQSEARDQYFHDVVAPQLKPDEMWPAYHEFRAATIPQPKPTTSATKVFAKSAALGAAPALGGFAGAEAAAGAVAPLASAAAEVHPLLGLGVEGLAALAGSIPSGWLAGKAQEAAIHAMPETAKRLGIDAETLEAQEKEHPTAAHLGEMTANMALLRPSVSGTRALLGQGTAKEIAEARRLALTGAAMGGVGDALQQSLSGQPIDWKDVGEQTLLGGFSNKVTGLGRKVGNTGRRLVGAEPMHEPQIHQPEEEPTAEAPPDTTPPPPPPPSYTKEEALFRDNVLAALKESPTLKQFKDVTGLDHKTAKAEMDRLVDEGYLTYNDKSGKYALVPENAQYSFVNEGERPQAALNEVPSEQAEPTAPTQPTANKRQMDLFANPEQPPLYVDQSGMASTVLPNRDELEVSRQKAAEQQMAALPEGAQLDIFGGTSKAPEPEAPEAPEAPTVSDQQKDLFGSTLHVDAEGRVYTGTTPENLAPPYLNDPRAEFFRQEALKKEKAAKDLIAAKEAAKQKAKDARAAKKKGVAAPAEPEVVTPTAPTAPAAQGEIFDEETYGKALDVIQAQGKATAPMIQKAAGVTRTKALGFMKELRTRGILDNNNKTTAQPPKQEAPAKRYRPFDDQSQLPLDLIMKPQAYVMPDTAPEPKGIPKEPDYGKPPYQMSTVEPELGPKDITDKDKLADWFNHQGLKTADQLRDEIAAAAGKPPSTGVLKQRHRVRLLKEQALTRTRAFMRGEKPFSPAAPLAKVDNSQRLRVIQELFNRKARPEVVKPVLPSVEQRRDSYRSNAADAFENGKISNSKYEAIADELKKPNPDFERIDDMLAGRKKIVKRDFDAASEKKQKRTLKELEAEADRLLSESGVDPNDFKEEADRIFGEGGDEEGYDRSSNRALGYDSSGRRRSSKIRYQRGTRTSVHNPQVDTPAFKNWFGNSKIVDENGKPKRMFHGARKDFSEFKGRQADAIFFAPDVETANAFSGNEAKEGSNPVTYPVYVKAENPFDYENRKHVDALIREIRKTHYADHISRDDIENGDWVSIENSVVQAAIKRLGHDGFHVKEFNTKNLGVYDPTQVKSAIGNRGTFDPNNPNITMQRGARAKGVVAHEDAVAAAKEATKGWKNAPDVNVVRSREDLPAHLRDAVFDDTRGFYDPDTKTVHVISENAPSLEGVKATVFHEALGHYGLADKFRGDLDSVLSKMYENPSMRKAADEWLKNNPDTYDHLNTDLQRARAVEEVLAERSEAGATTSGMFKRVIAWARDWMRRMGFDVKYSDNDITQILRQAHESVQGPNVSPMEAAFNPTARATLSPKAQTESDLRFMRTYASVNDTKPAATSEMMERGREVLSKSPSALRRTLLSGMSVNQIANEYEKIVPSLRTRHDVLNKKGAALRTDLQEVSDKTIKAHDVFKKYSLAEKQKMFDIMNRTTRDQIEVLDDPKRGWVANKTDPLYREFMALPKDVRDVYRDMRETYLKQSEQTLDFLSTLMSPSRYQRLLQDWKSKRLQVYLPLFRTGDHWLSYTDKSGEFVKRSFETPRERELAAAQAKQAGAKDIERYNNLQHMIKAAPPTGFFGEVVGALRKAKVSDSVIESVVDSYMKLLPAKSTLQMTRTRQGTAGYEQDVVRSFANVATSQAQHINNMKYNHELEGVMDNIRNEILTATSLNEANPKDPKGLDVDVAADLFDNVEKSHQAVLKPNANSVLAGVQYFNYLNYLAGNVSTAFVALSHLPTVVYPVLGRINGFDSAAKAMWNAGKHSTNYHFNNGKGIPPEIAKVIKRGIEDGVLGERRAEDIAEFKTRGTSRYVGIKAKADAIFNKMLGTADKTNRDTTLLAAYELYKNKLSKTMSGDALHEEAYKRAKQEVYDTLGSAYSAASANMMQHPIAKLFLTFKSFALNREYMLYKSFKDLTKGESPEVKKAALMQILGFFAMGGLMSGVQGMPLVGWGELFAKLVNDATGGDETFDPEEMLKQAVGTLAYKGPINYFTNLNVADRTGWDNMIWRDDEKRRNDVGFGAYAAEKMLGPTYTYLTQNAPNAWKHFTDGHLERAAEELVPKFAGNAMKGVRLGLEGATNKDGLPLKHDVNGYNAFMQILGFSPADLAEIQKENMNRTGLEKKIENSRRTLMTRASLARMTGDDEGFNETIEHIEQFNARHPGASISGEALRHEITNHYRRMAESVHGVSVRPKLRAEIMNAYPDEEEE